jgi:hypothetical protein
MATFSGKRNASAEECLGSVESVEPEAAEGADAGSPVGEGGEGFARFGMSRTFFAGRLTTTALDVAWWMASSKEPV